MENAASVGIAISFAAGLLSFLSPCVLPLIPSYVTFVTGLTLEDVQRSRRIALVHSLLFITGFTIIFLALGATATTIGRMLGYNREWVGRIGGVLVIVLGLYLLGVFNFGLFARERRLHIATKPLGYLGTVFVGMAFAAGWTPCIGPILGAVLTYTASSADLDRGLVLLFAYSMGLALPFVLAALMVDRFIGVFQRYRGALVWTTRAAGVLLLFVGVLMLTDMMRLLSQWLQPMTPEFLRSRL
ncbi:MAG: cytochrome c biogenesis protein CcdA [Gemmatimonadaceae bacterium]